MNKQKADSIITEYFHKIYGFAIKKSFSYDEAEDLCSDILQEVYLSLLKADEIINLEGYIWRISEHTYSKFVSSKKKRMGISIDSELFSSQLEIPYFDDYDSLLDDTAEEMSRLRREIAFLTQQRREIVYLFYYQNLTISEISSQTHMPEGTVKWHLNKARKELKEGFTMERTVGTLGINPIVASSFGHDGDPGNGSTEVYLKDKLNLNIVYSVYFTPRTLEEIAMELGITPVFIEDKVHFLEDNGFLVRTTGNRFTTYVNFSPRTYSREQKDQRLKIQLEIAQQLVEEYVPSVRKAIAEVTDIYIPGGNRELLDAAAIFYGIVNKSRLSARRDLSKYYIKPTSGGNYIACVNLDATCSDPDYETSMNFSSYWFCGNMHRWSEKYPEVSSWSIDTKYCSRQGFWGNNLTSDYEYLYEFIIGTLADNAANAEKYKRLREREYLTEDNQINIMLVKGSDKEFFAKIPSLPEQFKRKYADYAFEAAVEEAKAYPPQMQDFVISWSVDNFINSPVAIMVMDILYEKVFRPLTQKEKVSSQLLMFSDILP